MLYDSNLSSTLWMGIKQLLIKEPASLAVLTSFDIHGKFCKLAEDFLKCTDLNNLNEDRYKRLGKVEGPEKNDCEFPCKRPNPSFTQIPQPTNQGSIGPKCRSFP